MSALTSTTRRRRSSLKPSRIIQPIAAIPQLAELNIGHFLIGEAIFDGLGLVVKRMRELMDEAR